MTICGRREDKIQAAATELGDACRGVIADITVAADRRCSRQPSITAANSTPDQLREQHVSSAITELDETALRVFHTNVIAAMMLTGLCTPSLAQQQGAVVFVGSIHTAALSPAPHPMPHKSGRKA